MMKTDMKQVESYRSLTRYAGVYERVSETRTFKGKPDVCFDISYKVNGRKAWEKVGWASEGYSAKLAADVRAERVRSIRHKEELPRDKKKEPLFKDLAARYLEWAKENKKDYRNHKSRYDNHIAPRFEKKRMDAISPFDLERMKSELLKANLAPATVKHCLILVRQMFNKASVLLNNKSFAIYKAANPVKGVELPQLQNQRERFLSYQEAATPKGIGKEIIGSSRFGSSLFTYRDACRRNLRASTP